MWKWLHPYAKTVNTYQLCQTLLPWFTVLGLLGLVIGTVWGLAFAPPDYQQGDSLEFFTFMYRVPFYLRVYIQAWLSVFKYNIYNICIYIQIVNAQVHSNHNYTYMYIFVTVVIHIYILCIYIYIYD